MTSCTENKRIIVKIGSSSLTSQHGEVSRRKLEKLVDEIVQLKDEGHEVLVVSSGAVAAGYRKLGCLERPTSLPEKQAAASIGQGLLMEAYSELLLSHGYVASQILITRSDFLNENRYNNVRNTLNVLLERGIIPIVNENDTVTVDRLRFGDNDTLSAKVAGLVDANMLIILSDIEGLYSADPRTNSDASLVEKVHNITPAIEAAAGDSGSAVGTGGMRSKIDAVKIAMASGISTFLGKAGTKNILVDAVNESAKGTYFVPKTDTLNLDQKKQWIAFNSGPEGEVYITEDAKTKMINQKTGLLREGIVEINGEFKKGSVVRIMDHEGNSVGLGVINYSYEQLKLKPGETKQLHSTSEKVVVDHDDLVCHCDFSIPAGL
ncbi:glutamate 5-kinase [Cytobacillus suaedae]|nr:glutamate 5-kinase [Cytobacillus suaedae]